MPNKISNKFLAKTTEKNENCNFAIKIRKKEKLFVNVNKPQVFIAFGWVVGTTKFIYANGVCISLGL